jgi:2',3'-cyclic-nucleotide 2'-phosphodiesterase (5'-nucleotidase family)
VKRLFLVLLAGASLLLAQDDIRSFSILHTNDLHAQLQLNADGLGGLAYLAAEVRHRPTPARRHVVVG